MISSFKKNISFRKIKCNITDLKGNVTNIEFKDHETVHIDRLKNKINIFNEDGTRKYIAKAVSVCYVNNRSELYFKDFSDLKDAVIVHKIENGGSVYASSVEDKKNPGLEIKIIEKDGKANFFNFYGKIQRIEDSGLLEVWAGSKADLGLNKGTIDVRSLDSTAKSYLKLGTNKGVLEIDKDNPNYAKFLSYVRICKNLGQVFCSKAKNDIVIKDGNKEISLFPTNLQGDC